MFDSLANLCLDVLLFI
uniref:Uncharacterized protein n=1 Tax=Rhizophora mucronata TaxID=61149 RepID=A0A2P2NI15_RHIMU